MRRLLPAFVGSFVVAVSLATGVARADVTSPSPVFMPVPTPLQIPALFGEPTSADGLAPGLAVLPLRLSLMDATFPLAGASPSDPFQCAAREDPSGNSQYGFPVQHHVFLALTPRLVLHGFSRLGCPLDAVAGGGLTYSMPVAKNLWLVPSAGFTVQPSSLQGRALTKGDARLDLLMKTSTDRTLSVGVGRRGLKLTGTW